MNTACSFSHLLRREMVENRKSLLLNFAQMLCALLIVTIFMDNDFLKDNRAYELTSYEDNYEQLTFKLRTIYVIFMFVFGAFSVSRLSACIRDKCSRINTMMLPVADSVKFASRAFTTVVVFLVSYIVCVAISEFVRIEYLKIVCDIPDLQYYSVFSHIGHTNPWVIAVSTIVAAGFYLCISVYALGSTLWPRMSFVKTAAALLVVGIVVGSIFSWIKSGVQFEPRFECTTDYDTDDFYYEYFLSALFFLVGTVNWLLAYLRFKEWDVISCRF